MTSNIFDFDPFRPKTKKQRKREQVRQNYRKGKAAEDTYVMRARLSGYEVERTGRGHDFKVRKRDPWTGRVVYTGYREVKSGNAKLSKLQQKTKKRKSNYKVIHEVDNSLF
jgi:cytidylate kinase